MVYCMLIQRIYVILESSARYCYPLGAVTESLKGLSNILLSKVLQDSEEHGKLN